MTGRAPARIPDGAGTDEGRVIALRRVKSRRSRAAACAQRHRLAARSGSLSGLQYGGTVQDGVCCLTYWAYAVGDCQKGPTVLPDLLRPTSAPYVALSAACSTASQPPDHSASAQSRLVRGLEPDVVSGAANDESANGR